MEENKTFDLNEIVKIESLPKIFEQLDVLGELVDEKLKGIEELECTEENKTEVKNKRTEINNMLTVLESKRKEIKKAINTPYDLFNEKYESVTKKKLENASNTLKSKIDTIENRQKEIGLENIKKYFNEYSEHLNIHVDFDLMNLNVTLTGLGKNLEGKKYKDEIKVKLDNIASDLRLIELEEFREEILYEYNKNLDFAKSKLMVIQRHQEIDRLKEQEERIQEIKEQEQIIEEKVDEVIIAPKEIIEDEDIITVSFTVTGTKEKIKEPNQNHLKNKTSGYTFGRCYHVQRIQQPKDKCNDRQYKPRPFAFSLG